MNPDPLAAERSRHWQHLGATTRRDRRWPGPLVERTDSNTRRGLSSGLRGRLETIGRSLIECRSRVSGDSLGDRPDTGLDLSNGRISAPDWRWHPSSREAQSEIARAKKPRLKGKDESHSRRLRVPCVNCG